MQLGLKSRKTELCRPNLVLREQGLIMIAQLNHKRGLVGMFHFRRVNLIFDLHMLNVLLPIHKGATMLLMERASFHMGSKADN